MILDIYPAGCGGIPRLGAAKGFKIRGEEEFGWALSHPSTLCKLGLG